jgi:hypothetical protein
MKLNLTPLEVILFVVVNLIVYIWTRYGKRIRRWWEERRKQRRGPRHLKPKSPEACPRCAQGYQQLPGRPRKNVTP